jgi:hypothetical protein
MPPPAGGRGAAPLGGLRRSFASVTVSGVRCRCPVTGHGDTTRARALGGSKPRHAGALTPTRRSVAPTRRSVDPDTPERCSDTPERCSDITITLLSGLIGRSNAPACGEFNP